VVFVSHRMREIRQVADVCSILRNGLTAVDRVPLADISDSAIVERMGQRESAPAQADADRVRSTRSHRDATLGLQLQRGDFSVRVPAGSVLGLAGAPAGPTELIDQLVGANPRGRWSVRGRRGAIAPPKPLAAVRARIGYVSGDRASKGVLHSLPLADNLMASRRVTSRALWVRRSEEAESQKLLRSLGVNASIWRAPSTLSGGTQQKLLIARWMGVPLDLLVLEEPTRGVDIATKREIYAQIRAMSQAGATVVWWSTEGQELAEICDCVIAFDPDGEPTRSLEGGHISDEALAAATGMAG
jgi:ribose transport system ATP-binding protein